MTTQAAAPEPETTELGSVTTRFLDNIRSGSLGSWPVIIALAIVVLVFSQTAPNFFTPGNFSNITGLAFTAATGRTEQRLETAPTATIRRWVRLNLTGTFSNAVIAVAFKKFDAAQS